MKVISFSLWGNNPIYTTGAIKNALLAKEVYPDWVCWFYVGKNCPEHIIEELQSLSNVKVIGMSEQGDWTGMFWRFLPASDPSVDAVISRDTDSRLSVREKRAVDEWLSSDKGFHIMRDHPYHGTPILGGMWGAKRGCIPDMKNLIEDYAKGNFWQVDQNFLKQAIYPIVKNNAIIHDEYFDKIPFPTQRENKFFVGMAFDENDNPLHPEHMDFI
jgi:hypothetical protein